MKKKSVTDRFPLWRLADDPRTNEAVHGLLKIGMPKDDIATLLRKVCALPALWNELQYEPLKARQDRRAKLAKQIRQVAYAIEQDPEARHFRVMGPDAVTTSVSNRPTIANYLRDFSKLYEGQLNNSAEAEWLYGKGTTRMEYTEFVRREVALLLIRSIGNTRQSPIAVATKLTNALLGADIVTKRNLQDTFRHIKTKVV